MNTKLEFPQILEISVIDAATQQPIPRIGLMLTIFAPHKNNYHLAKVTDITGKAQVLLAEIRESVRIDQELFPMDYASSLEDWSAEIDVKVCNSEEVKKSVKAMEMFRSVIKIDESLLRDLKNSRNEDYLPMSLRVTLDKLMDKVAVQVSIEHL